MPEPTSISEAVVAQPQGATNRMMQEASRAENAAQQEQGEEVIQPQMEDSNEPPRVEADNSGDAEQLSKESVGESIIKTTTTAINKRIDKMHEALPTDQKEQADFLSKPENAGSKSLHAVDFLYDVKPDMGGLPELRFDPKDKPVQLQHNGQLVTLVSIKGISDADIFVLQAKDASGNLLPDTIKLPRSEVIDAQIVAETDGIFEAMPDGQKDVVQTGIDVLASRVLGTERSENPLEKMSNEQLSAKQKEANAVEKSLTEADQASKDAKEKGLTDDEKMRMRVYEQSGAAYTPFYEQFTLDHYDKSYEDAAKIRKTMREKKEKELGRKLTKEEDLLVSMQAVRHIQERNAAQYAWTQDDELLLQTWKANFTTENGKAPPADLEAAYKKNVIFGRANQKDLSVVLNKKLMNESLKKMSNKDKATIFAMLIALMGKEIVAEFLPPMSQR